MRTLLRLNLGSGATFHEGWTGVDRAGPCDVVHDLTDLPLPFEDSSCEGAVAHHVLDLLELAEAADLLADIHRVLRSGGVLRISLANLSAGIDAAQHGNLDWFPEPRGTLEETLGWFITQGGARRSYFSLAVLGTLIEKAGFFEHHVVARGVTRGPEWLTELDSRPLESFYVEAW